MEERVLLPRLFKKLHTVSILFSLSSLVKSSENGNGVTFRSGADVNMDIGVSGFGAESAIDRSMVMVSVVANDDLKVVIFIVFLIKETL